MDGDAEYREALRLVLTGTADLKCVSSECTAEDALLRISSGLPEILLVELQLPGMSGEALIRQMATKYRRKMKLVVLTSVGDTNRVLESFKAGARGYLLKGTSWNLICDAVRLAHAEGAPIAPEIAGKLIDYFRSFDTQPESLELSDREQEILQHVAQGGRNKEIAEDLSISVYTVCAHLRAIYKKLQVQSRAEAVRKLRGFKGRRMGYEV